MTKAVEYFVIGLGQGGSKMAKEFANYKYTTVSINTTTQDDVDLPVNDKLVLDLGYGSGTGKDLSYSNMIFESSKDKIIEFLKRHKIESYDQVMLCASLGGGTGSGSIKPMIEIIKELGLVINILVSIPHKHETVITMRNAFYGIQVLLEYINDIQCINVVSNEQADKLYNTSIADMYRLLNYSAVQTIHNINTLSTLKSDIMTIDKSDLLMILSSGGFCSYSTTNFKTDVIDSMEEIDSDFLFNSVVKSFPENVFVSGFDYQTTVRAGVFIVAKQDYIDKISSVVLNEFFEKINSFLNADIYKGVYITDIGKQKDDALAIYIIATGLNPPTGIDYIKDAVSNKLNEFEVKATHKQNNVINTNNKIDNLQFKNKNNPFYKILQKKMSQK